MAEIQAGSNWDRKTVEVGSSFWREAAKTNPSRISLGIAFNGHDLDAKRPNAFIWKTKPTGVASHQDFAWSLLGIAYVLVSTSTQGKKRL